MSNTQLRTVIYGRQSEKNDRSIDEQLDLGRKRCHEEGWALAGTYKDGVSASRHAKTAREDWPRLLAAVEGGTADVVWLWESSRGDRTLSTWAALLESCQRRRVRIYVETHDRLYDMNVPREWKIMAEDGVDSAYESDKTALRVRRAAAENAAAGKPHGRVVYGYRREYEWQTVSGRRKLVPVRQLEDPAEAAAVREIFGAVAGGQSLRAVAAGLNGRGARTRSGRPWTATSVREIALNPAYIAKRIHDPGRKGGRTSPTAAWYDAAWPALVGEQVFYAARAVLTDPGRKTSRPGGARHLLSLIARCGECGGLLTVAYPANTGRVPVYKCRDRSCVSIDQADLDEYVFVKVLVLLASDRNFRRLLAAQEDGDAELEAARSELAAVQADYDQTLDLFGQGKITAHAFAAVEPGKLARLNAAGARVRELETPPELRALAGGPERAVEERWLDAPLAAQRRLIRRLAKVTVGKSPVPGHRVSAARRTRVESALPPAPGGSEMQV